MQSHKNNTQVILVMDIGGTSIKSAVFSGGKPEQALPQEESRSDASAEEILAVWNRVISRAGRIEGIGIAMPGPFNYRTGISLMKHKFSSLYGMELKRYLPDLPVRFLHDANAFLLGELTCGSVRRSCAAGGITLGTGLGASVFLNGELLCSEIGTPREDVSLWNKPFRNGTAEEFISARWITEHYPAENVKQVASDARNGGRAALAVLREYGKNLAELLSQWRERFPVEHIVIGGQIGNDLDLFDAEFSGLPVVPSRLRQNAALYGAASLFH